MFLLAQPATLAASTTAKDAMTNRFAADCGLSALDIGA
jgi:hypothetical protein